ncbi:MAG TPA: single-stranded-DNA-specific exonuclease RecJ [Tepidisphaeraceae bacterium]|nr:single-stranded-DNA-specific exonuclease RecJ [Tepidisphaeraceae bacterium]
MLTEPHPAAAELAERLRISPLMGQLLLNRNLKDVAECSAFLRPSLQSLHDPGLLPGMLAAAGRIAKAIRDRQRIIIYGDYDVDGITATAILWHAIRLLGGDVGYYIPHRIDEGYGLNSEAIAQIIAEGANLIVTVDCGITAVEPAKIARDRGVDLIITDHHQCHDGAPLPDCFAIVHPRLGEPAAYPNPHLCGAGVAFKLAWGIGQQVSGAVRVSQSFREFLIEATALAALGTIADVVPLVGENRVLAHFGLSGLPASKLVGIQALIASAGLTGQSLDSFHVGFLLAPRLNACGRMGHAALAVRMLTDAAEAEAHQTATYLETQNRARQALEREIFKQAMQQVEQDGIERDGKRAVVLAAEKWHAGVIGIVASRLVERLSRPALMISLNNGHGQGSGRSIPGFHLSRALASCSQFLEAHGGHEMAAGLKLATENLPRFRDAFYDYAMQNVTVEMMMPQLFLEAEAQIGQISEALVADMARLGPFGHGNRRPLLCVKGVEIAGEPRVVGKTGDHLQLTVGQGQLRMKCIAFGHAPMKDRLAAGTRVDLAVEPCVNEFNGRRSVELEVKDCKLFLATEVTENTENEK